MSPHGEPAPPPRHGPYEILETPGPVAWCRCGRSRYQPYCDGSHAGTGLEPMIVDVAASGPVRWCGCKATSTPPYCDRSHCEVTTTEDDACSG
jgi:CDGSH-type Zn-finger protein